jgi:hypothetical protein
MTKATFCHGCSKGRQVPDTWGTFPGEDRCVFCGSRNVTVMPVDAPEKVEKIGKEKGKDWGRK